MKHRHYKKDVSHLKTIDVYRVLDLWGVTNPAVQHAVKKLLNAGQRGAKSYTQDLQEAIDSIRRALEMALETAGTSWDDAPEWAQWLAQDEDGSWWWYEQRPELSFGYWFPMQYGRIVPVEAEMPFTDDWKNSLCSRDFGNEDGWIPWSGGEMPVEQGVRVKIRTRDPESEWNNSTAWAVNFDWAHRDWSVDIIAYKVLEQ